MWSLIDPSVPPVINKLSDCKYFKNITFLWTFSLKDSLQALSFVGTRKLFINHWKFGLNEYKRAYSKSLFLKELQKMIPSLKRNDIIAGRSGVRAMALGNNGNIIDNVIFSS